MTEFSSGVRAIQSQLNSFLGYLSHFRANKTVSRVLKKSDLHKLFHFTDKANIIRFMMKTLIWGWEPPKYERYESGLYRILFNPQSFEETVVRIDPETGEEITETVIRYKVWYIERDLPNLTKALAEHNYLEAEKIITLEQIEAYDTSEAVNQFSVGDNQIWLDKSMRVGLNNSISKEIEIGREETTLWYDMLSFTIPCQTAMQMLTQLEIYALQCYNVTAQHKVRVKNAETLEELKNYDYRAGYPEKLHFNI